jgi:hypothetical protein
VPEPFCGLISSLNAGPESKPVKWPLPLTAILDRLPEKHATVIFGWVWTEGRQVTVLVN